MYTLIEGKKALLPGIQLKSRRHFSTMQRILKALWTCEGEKKKKSKSNQS